jgi:hypothetical protein
MYLTASLSPPSTLYAGSSTNLNIPYQNLNSLKTGASGQVVQSAPPPKHVYVNVNATYPYLSIQMQGLPVALQSYYAFVAYLLQQNPTPTVQCNPTCINVYSLPILGSNQGTDFAYACSNPSCTSVPTNSTMYLYNSNGKLCATTRTDYGGVAALNVTGSNGCSYPYSSIGTSSTSITISGLYATEAFTPTPFYTNFQGYNYATYAPLRTGPYLLHMFTHYYNAPYSILYPSMSYPDVAYPYYSCCDVFYNVEKHATNATISVTPGSPPSIATVSDSLTAVVQLTDSALHKGLKNVLVNYNLTMTNPGSGLVSLGSQTSNNNGTVTISLGQRAFGNYTLTITWSGNSTTVGINASLKFTVFKAKPILILRTVQEPVITFINPSSNGAGNSPSLDGATQAYCSHNTRQCTATLTTTQNNDIIIVYTVETLNLNGVLCTFSVSDTAHLTWQTRTNSINGNSNRDQLQEFWAKSPGTLAADAITESIGTACDSGYGGNYNGLLAFGVSGANYNNPFDPSSGASGSKTGTGGSPSIPISTLSANDIIFSGLLVGGSQPPATQSGFTTIIDGSSFTTASEYATETNRMSNFGVGFGDTAGNNWEEIADSIQGPINLSALPATGSSYRLYAYVGDDRPLQSSNWSCSWPNYHNCVILQGYVGQTPASTSRWLLEYWSGGTGSFVASSAICSFASCSPTWSTAPSSFCNGAPYCYYFAVDVCCFSSIINDVVQFSVNAFDIAGQSPVFGSYATGYGFVDNPQGSFIVNGNKVRSSDFVNATSNGETFQFNATQSPNLITSVSITVVNMTAGTTKTICLIGTGCLLPTQTTTQSFLLYPLVNFVFTTGAYNVTAYFTCSGCPNMQYRVMSIMLQFGRAGELASTQSPWIQGATALNPYYFRTYLYDNNTQSLLSVAGLSENVYINGTLLGSYATNSAGDVFFPWTPAISAVYNIQVTFSKQSYYTPSNYTTLISVQLRGLVLAVSSTPSNPEKGATVSWGVTAEDMVTKTAVSAISVTMYVDGTPGSPISTDSSGNAGFTYVFTSIGRHNVTFNSQATQVYNTAKSSNPLTVFLSTKVSLSGGTITVGQQNSLSVSLTDLNGNALPGPGRKVTVQINGVFYQNVTTDSNGNAQFTWRPDNTGAFTVTASYNPGTSNDIGYRSSSGTLSVNVVAQTVTNIQSTSGGTQSVSLPTASGTAQSGLSVSVTFPSLGWVNVNISFLGHSYQGTLHVWNEFGTKCVAWVFGVCVLVVPIWKVHFDANTNINAGTISLVTDFFLGTIQSEVGSLSGARVPYDTNSAAFTWGQNAINAAFLASVAVYFYVILQTVGAGEPAAAPAALAVLLAFVLAAGVAGFLAYQDKAQRENYLAGELAGIGLGAIQKFVETPQTPCEWPCIPLLDDGWVAYWAIVNGSSPWGRSILLMGLLIVTLTVLEALLLVSIL